MSLLIGILTVVLIFNSIFLVLVVLMQRAKSDGGLGAAMGGGSMESTFGAETGNVLSGATKKAALVFFIVSFSLYLAHIYQAKHHDEADTKLPTVAIPVTSAPLPMPVTATPAPKGPTTPPAPQSATPKPGESPKP